MGGGGPAGGAGNAGGGGGGGGGGNQRRGQQARAGQQPTEESTQRTVYVSDIDHQVTEEQLATLFLSCGQVVDCRICGDPNSVLRFAFVEFTDEEGAKNALSIAGTMLGYYPLRVLPSKTAILPVNPTYLPKSQEEREMCARTVYCTNIDKKVTQADVKLFFESLCGEQLGEVATGGGGGMGGGSDWGRGGMEGGSDWGRGGMEGGSDWGRGGMGGGSNCGREVLGEVASGGGAAWGR
ncbi:unnamed protein product [Closterium sp. NIES-54]